MAWEKSNKYKWTEYYSERNTLKNIYISMNIWNVIYCKENIDIIDNNLVMHQA